MSKNIKKARALPEHREERPDVDHIYMTRLGRSPIFIRPGGRSAAAPWWITVTITRFEQNLPEQFQPLRRNDGSPSRPFGGQ